MQKDFETFFWSFGIYNEENLKTFNVHLIVFSQNFCSFGDSRNYLTFSST